MANEFYQLLSDFDRSRSINTFIYFIVFLLSLTTVLNLFFAHGSHILDQGQIAGMLWKNSFFMTNPQLITGEISYAYADHVVFFDFIWSFLSSFLLLTPALNFALFHACGVMVLIIAIQTTLKKGLKLEGIKLYIAPLFALAFFFSGFIAAYNNYPHTEVYAVAFGLLFLVNLGGKKYLKSAAYFILSLSVREDIGFHLSGLLICISLLRFIQIRETHKDEIFFIIFGVAYSTAALIFQKIVFGEVRMTNAYLGDFYFSHLSLANIIQRLHEILTTKQFFWVPIVSIFLVSVGLRSLRIGLGVIAFIPWFSFNLLSTNILAATFQIYFPIFFVFSIFWPALMPLFFREENYFFLKMSFKNFLVFLQGVIILQSVILNPYSINNYFPRFSLQSINQLETLAQSLPYITNSSINYVIDDGIASLNPTEFSLNQLAKSSKKPVNTAIFFGNGPNFIHSLYSILTFKLDHIYRYGHTNTYVATSQENIKTTIPWLIEQPLDRGSNWKEFLNAFTNQMIAPINFSTMNPQQIFSSNAWGMHYWGPRLPLPVGDYTLIIDIESVDPFASSNNSRAQIELVCEEVKATLKSETLDIYKDKHFSFNFNIPWSSSHSKFSFGIKSVGKNDFKIKHFSLIYNNKTN